MEELFSFQLACPESHRLMVCVFFHTLSSQSSFPESAQIYYTDIIVFLIFNVGSLIGNFLTVKIKCPGPEKIWIPILLRTILVPLLMFCNFKVNEKACLNFSYYSLSVWPFL